MLLDRSGRQLKTIGEPRAGTNLYVPSVSPDGRRVTTNDDWDRISVWDIERGTDTLLTDETEQPLHPDWLPGGDEVVYSVYGAGSILLRRADGSGKPRVLLERANTAGASASPDGTHVVFYVVDPGTGRDLWALDLAKPAEPFPLLRTPANEALPRVSPDGEVY